jgi:hypothetical protein
MAETGRPRPMRQVAHFFASLLRHSCGSKTPESPLCDTVFAENRRSNRLPGQADRGGLSRPKGRASPARSQSSRRRGPTLPRRLSLSVPPTSPRRPAIRGDGFPWRGAPGRPRWLAGPDRPRWSVFGLKRASEPSCGDSTLGEIARPRRSRGRTLTPVPGPTAKSLPASFPATPPLAALDSR